MSKSDRAIADHRDAVFMKEDPDGVRLPDHQQWIESPEGSMWVDSRKRAILGYGPPVVRAPGVMQLLRLRNSQREEDRTYLYVWRMDTAPIMKLVVSRPSLAEVATAQEGQTEIESFHITLARLDDLGITKLPNVERLPKPPSRLFLKDKVMMVEDGQKRSCFAEIKDDDQEVLREYLRKCERITGVKLLDPNRVFHLTLSNAAAGDPRGSVGDVWKFDAKPLEQSRLRIRP